MAEEIAQLRAELGEVAGVPVWLQRNYTEPRVNYALQDLIKGGWTVFDVGANFGGLSVTMSRLAGPRGAVCSFEANPAIAHKCLKALMRNGCMNAQIYHGAIFSRSGEVIELYLSDNQVADSIHRKTDKSIQVQTLALDDFVRRTGLVPQLVKMDIEGAEPDALIGFEETIDRHHPIFILEQTPQDKTCFEFLFSKGYQAVDLQNYRRLESVDDIEAGTIVTDVLFASGGQLKGTPYAEDMTPVEVATLSAEDFSWINNKQYRSKSLDLPSGRYFAHAEFVAEGEANTMCGIYCARTNEALVRAHASSRALVGFAKRIVFDLVGDPMQFFFHFIEEADPSLEIKKITISRVPGFDAHRPGFRVA